MQIHPQRATRTLTQFQLCDGTEALTSAVLSDPLVDTLTIQLRQVQYNHRTVTG